MSTFAYPRRAFTMGQLLVTIFVVAIAVGLLVPAVNNWRERQARIESVNHLKTIGLAFHYYHDKHKHLPYNGTTQPYLVNGVSHGGFALAGDATTGSWAFQILPYVDQKALFATRNPSTGVPVFMCPGRGRPNMCDGVGGTGAWSDYFLNSFVNDPNGAWDVPNMKRTLIGISDGSSNTIIVAHGQIRPQDYGKSDLSVGFNDIIFKGGSAAMCRPNTIVGFGRDSVDSAPGNWGGPFPQGALMGMGDGTVRMFPYIILGGSVQNGACESPLRLGAFLTPSGGEAVTLGCG